MRKNILKIYGIVLPCGLLYYVFTKITGFSIPCMFYQLTSFQCPGCGMTRMFQALLRLDIYEAFLYQPVAFVSLIVWNVIALFLFIGKPKFIQKPAFLFTVYGIMSAAMIILCVIRNLT